MRILIFTFIVSLWLHGSLAHAADPQNTKQVLELQRQVSILQQEVTRLTRIIDASPDGTIRITAPQHKQETTGGNVQTSISGQQILHIGQAVSERIGTTQSIAIGTTQSVSVEQDAQHTAGRNAIHQAGGDLTLMAGKRTIITAGDQLILKTGQASIILNKNGDILLQGKDIQIKGSGQVNMKGSKVTTQ
ncbi:MAG: hypothetical protein KC643_14335 [Nitrospira sp.]|nr:hypothetical protein [Nitrospira sp.]